jgi:hypothetical protein
MTMSLQNLLAIGQLNEHVTDARQVARMLDSATRSLADARQTAVSAETRLDAAYRATMQLCMVALWANGYRPSRGVPGHHQTMIQSLVHSVGLERERMLLLNTFRVKRNAIDYTGEDVDEASVTECIAAAEGLFAHVSEWLAAHRPELIG